jgi:hypothetical protein
MFKVKNPNDIILLIDNAAKNELEELTIMFPDLIDKIKDNLLWGVFSNERIFKQDSNQDVNAIFELDYLFIEQVKKEIKICYENNQREIFQKSVEDILINNQFSVNLDIDEFESIILLNDYPLLRDETTEVIISLTIPDYHTVFKDKIVGNLYTNNNDWIIHYIDMYESWLYVAMKKLYSYYYQVGGHGRWIQGYYGDSYIAQINNDIGDAGSVYVTIFDKVISSHIDMY